MESISRANFIDVSVGCPEIAAWFEAWLAWRRIYNGDKPKAQSYFRIQIQISALPKASLHSERARYGRAIGQEEFAEPEIIGSDTVQIITKARSADSPEGVLPLVRSMLDSIPAASLTMLELITWDLQSAGEILEAPEFKEHLVLYGVRHSDGLLLKAIWIRQFPHDSGSLAINAPWAEEQAVLKAFRRSIELEEALPRDPETGALVYEADCQGNAGKISVALRSLTGSPERRKTEGSKVIAEVSPKMMAHAITYSELGNGMTASFSAPAAWFGMFFVRTFFGVNETLGQFLRRAACFFSGWLLFHLLGARDSFEQGLGPFTIVSWIFAVGFIWIIGWKAHLIYQYRSQMQTGFAKLYSQPAQIDLLPSTPLSLADDPAVKKCSADLASLGGQPFADMEVQNTGFSNFVRCFYFPAERIYFQVIFLITTGPFKPFPPKATFLLHTFFAENSCIATSSAKNFKKRVNLRCTGKCLPDVHDPEEMLQKHRQVLAEFQALYGTPLALSREEFLERGRADFEIERGLQQQYGYYHWTDAFREVFDLMRPEYRVASSDPA